MHKKKSMKCLTIYAVVEFIKLKTNADELISGLDPTIQV